MQALQDFLDALANESFQTKLNFGVASVMAIAVTFTLIRLGKRMLQAAADGEYDGDDGYVEFKGRRMIPEYVDTYFTLKELAETAPDAYPSEERWNPDRTLMTNEDVFEDFCMQMGIKEDDGDEPIVDSSSEAAEDWEPASPFQVPEGYDSSHEAEESGMRLICGVEDLTDEERDHLQCPTLECPQCGHDCEHGDIYNGEGEDQTCPECGWNFDDEE